MLLSPLAVKLPQRPRDIDLDSRCGSSHPLVQEPLANGATSMRDGGERAGWTGSSTASGGQEHLEPHSAGHRPLLSLRVLPSAGGRASDEWCCEREGWRRAGGVEGHLDSEGGHEHLEPEAMGRRCCLSLGVLPSAMAVTFGYPPTILHNTSEVIKIN
jgi:hypothetical protein